MQQLVTLMPDIDAPVSGNIFINRDIPLSVKQLLLKEGFTLRIWVDATPPGQEELNKILHKQDVLFSTGGMIIDKSLIEQNKHLKIISQASAGYNNIALETATGLGIMVANAPNTMTKATADIAFSLLLAASRKMFYLNDAIKKGEWHNFGYLDFLGQELHGKTLGVFGLGTIGFEMARLCKAAYGMPVMYHNRSRNAKAESELGATYVSFHELLTQSDVLSVHCNLTPETVGIFNKDVFKKMKPSAIFINVARGGVHQEADLIEALETKTIWGAGLDVSNPEPMHKDNPLLFMENVAVTPHIGSATLVARTAMAEAAAHNIIRFFNGEEVINRLNFI